MKKDFLNKVLYASFKFGKVFAVLALAILTLTMIGAGIYLLKTSNSKIVTPNFEMVKQSIENNNSNGTYTTSTDNGVSENVIRKEQVEKKYGKSIEAVITSANLKPLSYDMIVTNIARYDSKYQKQYWEGLSSFIPEAIEYIKNNNTSIDINDVNVFKVVLSDVIDGYNRMFDAEIERVDNERMAQLQDKIVAGSILAISILLFVICLFLPLLIKIEENTRQQLELTKREKENA